MWIFLDCYNSIGKSINIVIIHINIMGYLQFLADYLNVMLLRCKQDIFFGYQIYLIKC